MAEVVAIQRVSFTFEVAQGEGTLKLGDTMSVQLANQDLFEILGPVGSGAP
jgi:hypothetical protein